MTISLVDVAVVLVVLVVVAVVVVAFVPFVIVVVVVVVVVVEEETAAITNIQISSRTAVTQGSGCRVASESAASTIQD